jgi:hypothetical protein
MCDGIIDGVETTLKNYKPRKKFELYKVIWVNHFYYLEDQ